MVCKYGTPKVKWGIKETAKTAELENVIMLDKTERHEIAGEVSG